MAEDGLLGRRRRRRGPLVVMNGVSNDVDEESDRFSNSSNAPYSYAPPPLPSPSSRSPYAEHPSLPSTSYTPRNPPPLTTNMPEQSHHYRSNPSLSSPSGSSSPAVDTSPPPSTPGQSAPPVNLVSESLEATEKPNVSGADDRTEVPQQTGVRASIMDKVRQHFPHMPHQRRLSNQRPQTVRISCHIHYWLLNPSFIVCSLPPHLRRARILHLHIKALGRAQRRENC